MKTMAQRIKLARTKAKLSQEQLGKAFRISREAVALWESGKNAPTADKLGKIAELTGVTAEWLMSGGPYTGRHRLMVPVMGYVGAGAEVHPFDAYLQGASMEEVEPPPGYSDCVAARIRGDSMHPFQENWLVFWRREFVGVSEDCLGKLSVVQVRGGPMLIKVLRRGGRRNLWTLESWNAPPRENVPLEWASRVIDVRPV